MNFRLQLASYASEWLLHSLNYIISPEDVLTQYAWHEIVGYAYDWMAEQRIDNFAWCLEDCSKEGTAYVRGQGITRTYRWENGGWVNQGDIEDKQFKE